MTVAFVFRITILLVAAVNVKSAYRKVCYYTNWSQYRFGTGKFLPENVDPNLCSHIIYSFANLNGNKLHTAEWNDESTPWTKGMYARFNELKTVNSNLKTLLAVGGWSVGTKPFQNMTSTDVSRREFANTSIKFLRDHNFDGLDLDWEYPDASDKQNFIELLKTLRQEFDNEAATTGKPKLILSVAVPAGKDKIDDGYDIPNIVRYVDMINLMTYDLHGSWDVQTGHNSGLFQHTGETGDSTHFNVDWVANYWVNGGAPASMINIGLALYGRSFTLFNSSNHDIGSPAKGPGDPGPITGEKGFMSYYEVCELLQNGGTKYYLKDQMVPYAINGSQWIGYEDGDSLRTKVQYIKQHGFGGTMVWALDLDDFQGTCGQGKYPLINAINDELTKSGGAKVTAMQQPSSLSTTTQSTVQTTASHQSTHSSTLTHSVAQTTASQNSTSICAGKSSGFVADPTSCDSYYICAGGTPFLVHCAAGLQYNSQTNFCDWPKNANCSIQQINPSTSVTTNNPIQQSATTSSNSATKLLVFTNSPQQTNSPTHTSVNTNGPTKLLVFTNAPAKTNVPTTTPANTNSPTKLLVFTPSATNKLVQTTPAPTNSPTQNPFYTRMSTKLLVFTNAPVMTTKPATHPPATTPWQPIYITGAPLSTSPSSSQNFCQNKQDGLYRDSNNCGFYYQCSYGLTFYEPCAPGLAFNEQKQQCDYPYTIPACFSYHG